MAINKVQKVPRGLDVQGAKYQEISDGQRPALEVFPANYLPVIKEEKHHELWVVIEAGTIVAFDQTSLNSGAVDNEKWLVVANGGAAQTLTYTADDINLTLDIDEHELGNETHVAAAGNGTKQVAANFPAGFAPYDYYAKQMEKTYFNNFPQPNVAFVCDYLVEVPLIYDTGATSPTQDTLLSGHLVKPGANGEPVKWVNGSHSVEQIVGRAVHVVTIAVQDALDKVHTVPGFALPGTGTAGRQLHEYNNLDGTSTLCTRKARINITLA